MSDRPVTCLDAALSYAARGWPVFPVYGVVNGACACGKADCENPAKHPCTSHGLKDATTDPATIRGWLEKWPGASVAIATGAGAGLVVIDTDPRHAGDKTLVTLEQEHGALPRTVRDRTGGGGEHRYLRHPGFKIKSRNNLLPGIDVKADGGYVIAPPSGHISGGHYEWVEGEGPGDIEIAPIPLWLLDILSGPSGNGATAQTAPPATAATSSAYGRAALKRECTEVAETPEGGRNERVNLAAFRMGGLVAGGELDEADARAQIGAAAVSCGLPESEASRTIESGLTAGQAHPRAAPKRVNSAPSGSGQSPLVLDPHAPLVSAQEFVKRHYWLGERRVLHHHAGEAFAWNGTHYAVVEAARLRSEVYSFLECAVVELSVGEEGGTELVPFNPNKNKVDNVLDALRAETHLDVAIRAPAWLVGSDGLPPAAEIIACRNGLLHIATGRLITHTPDLFIVNSLPYDYDPAAPEPRRWRGFLAQIWEHDPAAIDLLQEWFGYGLIPDTRQQKILLLVGPPRSGKGTIARVQTALVGRANVAGPTLASFAQNFGLHCLIGMLLGIIADARLSGRADQAAVLERLLSISGEDSLSIPRKYLPDWTGQVSARLVIVTNELPRLADPSGALANRFLPLQLTRSFLGHEDPSLGAKLLEELPGILNWAIEGWKRLQARGHFLQPASAADVTRQLMDLSSPTAAFVREICRIGPALSVGVDAIYGRWKAWCKRQGKDKPGTKQVFGRDLRAAFPAIRDRKVRTPEGKRVIVYEGIGLQEDAGPQWSADHDPCTRGAREEDGGPESSEHNGEVRGPSRTTQDGEAGQPDAGEEGEWMA